MCLQLNVFEFPKFVHSQRELNKMGGGCDIKLHYVNTKTTSKDENQSILKCLVLSFLAPHGVT